MVEGGWKMTDQNDSRRCLLRVEGHILKPHFKDVLHVVYLGFKRIKPTWLIKNKDEVFY
jgi:hypothetical protein